MADNNNTYSFIPWLRRGLSRQINPAEVDTFASIIDEGPTLKRASLRVKTTFNLTPIAKDGQTAQNDIRTETINISLVGPGDVSGLQPISILQVVPANGVKNFESNYFPFIEFFEEDIPWRYTPAKEAGDRLRPWLTLLICKNDEFFVTSNNDGLSHLSLKITDDDNYRKIFPKPKDIWKSAHVQFSNKKLEKDDNLITTTNRLLNENEDIAFSRLLSMRKLEDNTAYNAFLIPSFETGRLSGLSLPFNEIPAQRAAWAESFDLQKTSRIQPFDFPIYHQWEFETSTADFITLARKLIPIAAETMPAALRVDVQNMGNGLSYSTLSEKPKRNVIDVEVATKPINFESEAFPNRADEHIVADVMKNLLSKNPTLLENMGQIGLLSTHAGTQKMQKQTKNFVISRVIASLKNPTRKSTEELEQLKLRRNKDLKNLNVRSVMSRTRNSENTSEMDDPWIVPPLYGTKHIMATSLEIEDNIDHSWFPELNLDVRHRSAAGLGKKVVQNNQEEFVHRAWEQVELINELNQRLREYLLNLQLNSSLYQTRFNSKYLKDLMIYLQPMKYAPIGEDGGTLNDEIVRRGIPSAYASSAFQSISSSKSTPEVTTASLSKAIVDNRAYKMKDHLIKDLLDKEQIEEIFTYYQTSLEYKELIKYEELWKSV